MTRPLVLVTGAAGRVGTALRPFLRERFDLRLHDRVPVADQAGTIGLVALPEGLAGAPPVATCVRTEASTLKLITWDLP